MDPRQFLAQVRAGIENAPRLITASSHRLLGASSFGDYNKKSAYNALDHLSHVPPARIAPEHIAAANGYSGAGIHGGWTADEDKLLLLGVATSGIGKWTQIRDDFLMVRNSAQMNQRFARLAGRRSVYVDLNEPNKYDKSSKAANTPNFQDEYKMVRTKFTSPEDEKESRRKLPMDVKRMLEKFSEDEIWDSIAIRHLLDQQSKSKKSGRPQKYPLPIPIPKEMQKGNWVDHRDRLIERPKATFTPKDLAEADESDDDDREGVELGGEEANARGLVAAKKEVLSVAGAKRSNGHFLPQPNESGHKRSRDVFVALEALNEQHQYQQQQDYAASQGRVDLSSSSAYPATTGHEYLRYNPPLEQQIEISHQDGLSGYAAYQYHHVHHIPPPNEDNTYHPAMGSYERSLVPLAYQNPHFSHM